MGLFQICITSERAFNNTKLIQIWMHWIGITIRNSNIILYDSTLRDRVHTIILISILRTQMLNRISRLNLSLVIVFKAIKS